MKSSATNEASALFPAILILLTILLLCSAARPCAAQWAATYAGVGAADAEYIQQTRDGGYIVVAESNLIAGGQDFWVFKLAGDGTVQWQKLYGGAALEDAQPIQQTSDGGYIVAGQTHSFGDAANGDVWVIKLFPDGNVDWQKTYGGGGEDEAMAIQQTDDDGDGVADDGYIVANFTDSFGAGGDIWLLKLGAAGNVQWQKTYGAGGREDVFSIRQTSDHGYIVAGVTDSFGAGDQDVWILKLKPDNAVGGPGQIDWQKIYDTGGNESPSAIQQTDDDGGGVADDGYVVAGLIDAGAGGIRFWVFKINADGTTIAWSKIYGAGPRDFATSIQQTNDHGYIVAGATGIPPDFWVLKLFPDGNVDWQKAYGGPLSERRAESIEMTMDGGFITAGSSQSFGTGNDVLVIKLRQDGSIGPSCNLARGTEASVVDSEVTIQATAIDGSETGVIPQTSTAEPQDTTMSANFVCRTPEDCRNGTDDDLDGQVDCEDRECWGHSACPAPVPLVTPLGWIAMVVVVTLCGIWGLCRTFGSPLTL